MGRNAFAHEAGIHQDGLLKDRRTYEIMRAEDVGPPEHDARPRQALGPARAEGPLRGARRSTLSRLELDELYRRMIKRTETRKVVEDRDLLEMARRCAGPSAPAQTAPAATARGARAGRAGATIDEPGYGFGV